MRSRIDEMRSRIDKMRPRIDEMRSRITKANTVYRTLNLAKKSCNMNVLKKADSTSAIFISIHKCIHRRTYLKVNV